MHELEALKIIVTRPAHQAQNFIDELNARHAQVISFPTIEIRFRSTPLTRAEQLRLTASSLWIFTSANAVTGALKSGLLEKKTKAAIACIGPSTAAVLASQGITADLVPEKNSDSESLLRMLDSYSFHHTATIIRGGEGRTKLSVELGNRGVSVHTLDVYERALPFVDKKTTRLLIEALPCIISITSNQGLCNLLELVPADSHRSLFNSDLIVNSSRCQHLARNKGFCGNIIIASPPGDKGQLSALLSPDTH